MVGVVLARGLLHWGCAVRLRLAARVLRRCVFAALRQHLTAVGIQRIAADSARRSEGDLIDHPALMGIQPNGVHLELCQIGSGLRQSQRLVCANVGLIAGRALQFDRRSLGLQRGQKRAQLIDGEVLKFLSRPLGISRCQLVNECHLAYGDPIVLCLRSERIALGKGLAEHGTVQGTLGHAGLHFTNYLLRQSFSPERVRLLDGD